MISRRARWGSRRGRSSRSNTSCPIRPVTSAIPGTARMAYRTDNLGAAQGSLPDEATRQKMVAFLESA
jgi:hypothetical protein